MNEELKIIKDFTYSEEQKNLVSKLRCKEYKNYIELCKEVGLEPKTSNSKKAQMKLLSTVCDYEQIGRKIVVYEVFSEPSYELSSGKYIESIEKLILDLLAQYDENEYCMVVSITKLCRMLDMVNDNYVENFSYSKHEKLSKHLNIDRLIIEDAFETIHYVNKRRINRALKDLEDKALINWTDNEYQVAKLTEGSEFIRDEGGIVYDNYTGFPQILGSFNIEVATLEEVKIIGRVKRETLDEMGFIRESQLNVPSLVYEKLKYRKLVSKKLIERYGIIYYFKSYRIIYNYDHIKKELERLKRKERVFLQKDLNNKSLEGFYKTVDKKGSKIKEKYKNRKDKNNRVGIVYIRDFSELDKIKLKKDYEYKAKRVFKFLVERGYRDRRVDKGGE